MDVATLLSIAVPVASFLIGHFHLLLPSPTSGAPTPPSTFGHGELIKYLLQMIANGSASVPPVAPVTPSGVPSIPSLSPDLIALISQVLALLEKQQAPVVSPTLPPPSVPK